MLENNVFSDVFSSGYDEATLFYVCQLQNELDARDVLARLVVISAFRLYHMDTLEEYFIFSNAQRKYLARLIDAVSTLDDLGKKELKILKYRYNDDVSIQSVLLYLGWQYEDLEDDVIVDSIDFMLEWEAPEFPVTGEDVLEQGLDSGPKVGKVLEDVEKWWIAGDFKANREETLAQLSIVASAHKE